MSIEVPQPERIPGWATDSAAKSEDKNWADVDKLQGRKTANDIMWLTAYGYLVVVFLFFFALLFLGSLGAWSLHYILPETCHWLSDAQLSKIQSVLFSGSIGGVVSIIAQRQLSK